MKPKRTEIMIEIDEVICMSSANHPPQVAWCSDCGVEVLMIMPQEAARLAQVSVRQVNRSVEAGQVHFLETAEGLLLVCMNSLARLRSEALLLEEVDQKLIGTLAGPERKPS